MDRNVTRFHSHNLRFHLHNNDIFQIFLFSQIASYCRGQVSPLSSVELNKPVTRYLPQILGVSQKCHNPLLSETCRDLTPRPQQAAGVRSCLGSHHHRPDLMRSASAGGAEQSSSSQFSTTGPFSTLHSSLAWTWTTQTPEIGSCADLRVLISASARPALNTHMYYSNGIFLRFTPFVFFKYAVRVMILQSNCNPPILQFSAKKRKYLQKYAMMQFLNII